MNMGRDRRRHSCRPPGSEFWQLVFGPFFFFNFILHVYKNRQNQEKKLFPDVILEKFIIFVGLLGEQSESQVQV